MTDKMREEFEAWMHTYDLPPDLEGCVFDNPDYPDADIYGQFVYDDLSTQRCWMAWQASRAALVVDLPETSLTGTIGVAHKAVTKRCREAIEAAGVQVK